MVPGRGRERWTHGKWFWVEEPQTDQDKLESRITIHMMLTYSLIKTQNQRLDEENTGACLCDISKGRVSEIRFK